MNKVFEITFSSPSMDDYNMLRKSVGWEPVSKHIYETAMSNSVVVSAHSEDRLVGFARMITDYGMLSLIVDVMVHPEMQGLSIGKHLVKSLMEIQRGYLEEGDVGYANVLSSVQKEGFYKKMGFMLRPNVMLGSGMTAKLRPKKKEKE